MLTIVYAVLTFISGIGAFLFGIKTMSECISKVAGSKLTKNLNKLTNNRVKGVFFGFSFTAIMQSSSATIALLVGFAGAGVLSFAQTIAVVFGANVGTVVTEFLVSFQVFKVSELFAAMAGVGTFVFIFSKNDKRRNIAKIFIGIGLLFVGIKLMTSSTSFLGDSDAFRNLMLKIKNPFLLILIGFVFTVIIQSSLGSVVVLMGIAATGGITLYQAAFFLFGANVGTTLTAFIASSGTTEGKRVALTHFLFNAFGAFLFTILLLIFRYDLWIIKLTSNIPMQIVVSNLVFKLGCALILLPFVNVVDRIIKTLVKEKAETSFISQFVIDESVLEIPSLALHKVYELNIVMIDEIKAMLEMAMEELKSGKSGGINKMVEKRDKLYAANLKINDQITRIIARDTAGLQQQLADQIKLINELSSIIKHSYIFYESIVDFLNQKAEPKLIKSVEKFYEKVCEIIETGKVLLKNEDDISKISSYTIKIIELEEELSVEKTRARKEQIANAIKKEGSGKTTGLYLSMIAELEDIGGKLSGISVRAK